MEKVQRADCCKSPDVDDLGSNPISATLQLWNLGMLFSFSACFLVSMVAGTNDSSDLLGLQ